MHTVKSLKTKKIIFLYNKENKKNICYLACILALITSLLKSWELGQYFKKIKKIFLFCFNIWDYEFIRKTYSWYKKGSSFIDIRPVKFHPHKIRTSLLRRAFLEP